MGNAETKPQDSQQSPDAAAMMNGAQREMEAMTDMFTRMTDQCYRKCVTHYNDSELSKGESVCVERCVYKYLDVQRKVGERMSRLR